MTSTDSGGPTYGWIDITQTGTLVSGLGDDNSAGPFGIPFPFHYYGQDYNQIKIGSNGWLGFLNTGNIASCFPSIPMPGGPADAYLAPFMSDLSFIGTGNPGTAYMWTNGVDSVIVSYENVPFWENSTQGYTGSNTFQVILDASDSSVVFQYKNMNPSFVNFISCPNDIVVGIESDNGTCGHQVFQDSLPSNGFVIKFRIWNIACGASAIFNNNGVWCFSTVNNSVSISFIPNPTNVTCPKIGLIQTLRVVFYDQDSAAIAPVPYSSITPSWAYRDDDATTNGTVVDHLFCEKDPYYNGYDVPQDTPAVKGEVGPTGVKAADMGDAPVYDPDPADWPSNATRVEFLFEVCAVCIEGPNKGMVFGCIRWKYSREKNGPFPGVSTLESAQVEPQSQDHQAAIDAFNTNHTENSTSICPEEVPKGTCGDAALTISGPTVLHVNDTYYLKKHGMGLKISDRNPDDPNLILFDLGNVVDSCNYIYIPAGENRLHLHRSTISNVQYSQDSLFSFDATYIDLFEGKLTVVETGRCDSCWHHGIRVKTCNDSTLAAMTPISDSDSLGLVFYFAEIDTNSDAVLIKNSFLSSHSIQAQKRGATLLDTIVPGDFITYNFPNILRSCYPLPVSIQDQIWSSFEFDVYPNPSNNEIIVRIMSENLMDHQLEITNLEGKIVRFLVVTRGGRSPETTVNLSFSGLPSGMYFLSLRNSEGLKKVKKVIINR